jgi:hypothetical protein
MGGGASPSLIMFRLASFCASSSVSLMVVHED